MPTKKTEELRAMSNEELQAELTESESYLQKLKFDHAIKGLENPLILRSIRRDVARIHTEVTIRKHKNMTAEESAGRSKIRNRRK